MNYLQQAILFSTLIFASCATQAKDSPAALVPSGLSSGDQFYLISFTVDTTTADTTALSNLTTFVNTDITTNGTADVQSVSWVPMVGTTTANCSDVFTNIGVPIYNINGLRIGENTADIFDSSIENAVSTNTSGATLSKDVWVGCDTAGGADSSRFFGKDSGVIWYGRSLNVNSSWLLFFSAAQSYSTSVYVVSELLTVPSATKGNASPHQW